jgi:hypothetical protein
VARRRLQWRIAAAVAALAVVASIVAIGVSSGGSSRQGAGSPASVSDPSASDPVSVAVAPPPTAAPAPPRPVDVAAARACEAFAGYLADAQKGSIPATAGRTLIEDASVLLQGAQSDQAAGRALPPWAALGADLLAAAEDVVSHTSSALTTDGAAAGAQCRTVPAAAARAGGFQRAR